MVHSPANPPPKVSIDPKKIALVAVPVSLVGVYSGIPAIAAVLALPAIIWGADAVRRIASYGLGTGVPSIGNLAASIGVISALVGLKYTPALGLAMGAATGFIFGHFVDKFKILNIPHLRRFATELAAAASLALMGLMEGIAKLGHAPLVLGTEVFSDMAVALFAAGFAIPIYWATSLSMFHPYNVSLGAAERQGRTLRVAINTSGMAITLAGVFRLGYLAMINQWGSMFEAVLIVILGVIIWAYGVFEVFRVCKRESASVVWTGVPPRVGGSK
ncbi:MAG: tetrahydromethanopterin S-methyltransferase subunit C [Candidatus Methanomethylicota archaeon]|uniref:Tetrahydromethanopterin S-methyltransferase subunit C n=1 Tax=Thermoproteota archaeon TaxID=2056631 RepID=A0A497ER62_9CREN|nr:MAG: tetrahydromethanopterin S-methyltransferase subunit C [Candidatus Verstraetearchaeota archaeon]RLE53257.1 MAG: tetrahydromethanopterin S-methyltransferase subunit C [Candidatus Verstraetearchaeota archaeon]